MIPGVTIAGHTGRVVIEPMASTDDAAAMWLRPKAADATCVWLTATQLRALAAEATERADALDTTEPWHVARITALAPCQHPKPEPPRTWTVRLADLFRPATPREDHHP